MKEISQEKRLNVKEISKSEGFYEVPKFLIHDRRYRNLSNSAKLLYALLMDRMNSSIENERVDEEGFIYVIYPRENMSFDLNVTKNTVITLMKELKKAGLVEEKQCGLCMPNKIYIHRL